MLTSKDSKEMIEDPICLQEENTGTHYIGISCLSVRIMTKRNGLKQCKHLKIPQINECPKKKEERKRSAILPERFGQNSRCIETFSWRDGKNVTMELTSQSTKKLYLCKWQQEYDN